MSVVKSKRGQGKLLVYTRANELAVYTIQICSNEKHFPKRYRWCITNEIVQCALMFVLPKKVTHERHKLKKLVELCRRQVLSREDIDKCFTAWKAHASKGNSYNLINGMTVYYNDLWR